MLKKTMLLILLLGSVFTFPVWGFGQLQTRTFEELESLQLLEKRPVVVFIYTDWCSYCLAMESTTLNDPEIIEKLNSSFYFIAFNAENETEVRFRGTTFRFQSSGNGVGVHELALAFAPENTALTYPNLCVLNPTFEIIFQYGEFLNKQEMNLILNKIPSDRN